MVRKLYTANTINDLRMTYSWITSERYSFPFIAFRNFYFCRTVPLIEKFYVFLSFSTKTAHQFFLDLLFGEACNFNYYKTSSHLVFTINFTTKEF